MTATATQAEYMQQLHLYQTVMQTLDQHVGWFKAVSYTPGRSIVGRVMVHFWRADGHTRGCRDEHYVLTDGQVQAIAHEPWRALQIICDLTGYAPCGPLVEGE